MELKIRAVQPIWVRLVEGRLNKVDSAYSMHDGEVTWSTFIMERMEVVWPTLIMREYGR